MSRVLVTGATGFVGRQALAPLVSAGHEVHAVARAPGPPLDGVTWHAGDLLAPGAAERLVAGVGPSHLLHLAWYAEHGRFWTSPENVRWVEASLALLRAFAAAGGRRAVLAGTCAEYDWTAADGTFAEDAPLAPATLYGAAKRGLHEVAAAFAAQAEIALAWGRLFFLYGPHEHPDRLVASVARAIAEGRPAEVSSGVQERDFMHVEDAARAFCAILDSAVSGPVNVATGEPARIADVVRGLAEAAGRPDLPRFGALPDRPGDPPRLVADARRLRDEVGFTPRHDLDDGLRGTLAWWREEGGA
jgi:nucleoside-diphosphate-sugar epimerase